MVRCVIGVDVGGTGVKGIALSERAASSQEMAWLRSRIEEETLLRVTGCAITQKLVPTKLLWLRTHEPKVH